MVNLLKAILNVSVDNTNSLKGGITILKEVCNITAKGSSHSFIYSFIHLFIVRSTLTRKRNSIADSLYACMPVCRISEWLPIFLYDQYLRLCKYVHCVWYDFMNIRKLFENILPYFPINEPKFAAHYPAGA